MSDNQKSKKQVARDYFASLNESIPLRERVDDLVEYMKIQFVNGQTERVVFNYIRDIIPDEKMPRSNDEVFQKIIERKFLKETNYYRETLLSNDKNRNMTIWNYMNSLEKILKILPLVNLYAPLLENRYHCFRRDGKLYLSEGQEVKDNGWISRVWELGDDLKNIFPFHSKSQLDHPISNDTIVEISKIVLSQAEAEEMRVILKKYISPHLAFEELKKGGSSSSHLSSGGGVKNSGGSSGLGGIILALMLLALLGYVFLKPSSPSASRASESNVASDAGGSGGYSAGSSSTYSGSSSSIRNSMASDTQEKYDNLSSEGKAYVDDQMKKADEFCARHPDVQGCW
ncbi:hypothetical protein [Novosphingobium sp. PASSN1]|uniref:hypothetical protein n=1 Tax=Novosphingobium sp. PASSN1 TaxID=2015561 RepID=UPI0025EC36A7|nr:hypothetical protein [Novosphingobium sp. PASSN1]